MKILKGKQPATNRRVLLYGVHGVGKSTWASSAPESLVIDLEGGVKDIDCMKTERITSYDEVLEIIKELLHG
jgi:hypothetical protein